MYSFNVKQIVMQNCHTSIGHFSFNNVLTCLTKKKGYKTKTKQKIILKKLVWCDVMAWDVWCKVCDANVYCFICDVQ